MSSRILRQDDGAVVEPLFFRSADAPSVPKLLPAQPLAPGAHLQNRAGRSRPTDDVNITESELQARLEAAQSQARIEGEAIGLKQAAAKLEPVIQQLSRLLDDLSNHRKRLRAEAEEDTVKLSLAIARRVLHREIAIDPEAMLGLVKAAFSKLNARETHRLRIAPQDAVLLEQHRAKLSVPPALIIYADTTLIPGSAIFETTRGEVDASIDTQLAEIDRGLTDVLRRRGQ